jgi:hypothetical protein
MYIVKEEEMSKVGMDKTELEKILDEIEKQEKKIFKEETKLYSIKSKINEPVKQIAERWFEIIKKYDDVLDIVSRYSFIDSQYYDFESCHINKECGEIDIFYEPKCNDDIDEWFSLPLNALTDTENYFKDLEEIGSRKQDEFKKWKIEKLQNELDLIKGDLKNDRKIKKD